MSFPGLCSMPGGVSAPTSVKPRRLALWHVDGVQFVGWLGRFAGRLGFCSATVRAGGQSTWSTALPPMRRCRRASIAGAGWRQDCSNSIWPSRRPSVTSEHSRLRSLVTL